MTHHLNILSINKEHCFIKKKGCYHKIPIKDIYYMKAEGDYVNIYTAKGRYINTSSLSELEEQFEGDGFFRTHRSYLVNIKNLTSINTETNVIVIGEQTIPLSRKLKGKFLKKFRLID